MFWLCVFSGKKNWALNGLVIVSLFFYGWWEVTYLPILIGSIFMNFGLSRLLEYNKDQFIRRVWLSAGITTNLMCLAYFKYAGFFAFTTNQILDTDIPLLHLALPLGISFYTFQNIAYLCDIYQRKITTPSFRDYGLFVSFFPQLIAGPIVHAREILPQLLRHTNVQEAAKNIAIGLGFFTIGLFKKVIIADSLAQYATPAFTMADTGDIGFYDAWAGALAYTFQLYFDFSGYSDMAIGLALMVGIRLPYNFLSPYRADSIIEFWRRWHITMSRFFRDYVYIPLGGNREGGGRALGNLMMTMLLAGLWHGAGWTFVFWGGLHGLYLIINHTYRIHSPFKNRDYLTYRVASHLLTLLAVVVGWVFFRSADFESAYTMLAAMASFEAIPLLWSGQNWLVLSGWVLPWIVASYLICLLMPNTAEFFDNHENRQHRLLSFALNKRYAAVLSLLLVLSIFNLQKISEFLYFQF